MSRCELFNPADLPIVIGLAPTAICATAALTDYPEWEDLQSRQNAGLV